MELPIVYKNDGKEEWQSVEASLDIGNGLANIYVVGFGKNEAEAEK